MMEQEETSETIQNKLEGKKSKDKKYEARYKHGGPMRTTKKKS